MQPAKRAVDELGRCYRGPTGLGLYGPAHHGSPQVN